MKQLPLKAIFSCLLLLSFFLLCVSGAMLYLGKTGLILGFSRAFLLRSHARLSLLMLLLVCGHLALNWRLFRLSLKKLLGHKSASIKEKSINK